MPKYDGPRYFLSPSVWFDESDLERYGPPETRIYCGTHVQILGLHIEGEVVMLAIKLLDGVPDSTAITDKVQIVSEAFQRNPNRSGDPAIEEGD